MKKGAEKAPRYWKSLILGIRIFLGVLIVIGVILMLTDNFWLPPFTAFLVSKQDPKTFYTPPLNTQRAMSPEQAEVPIYNPTPQPMEDSPQLPAPSIASSTEIHEPFDFATFFQGEYKGFYKNPSFTNPNTSDTVSFVTLTDKEHQAVNSTYDAYVNGKLAGELGGEGVSVVGFSPDNNYFVLRTRSNLGCAGGCQEFDIYVIDLHNLKVIDIYKPDDDGYLGFDQGTTFKSIPVWTGGHIIEFDSFYVALDSDGETEYRISPIQVWDYDPATLTQTLKS